MDDCSSQADIPCAVISERPVSVSDCEYVPDAYEAIQTAIQNNEIVFQKYEDNDPAMLRWIEATIKAEYQNAEQHPDYRAFLRSKFSFLSDTTAK